MRVHHSLKSDGGSHQWSIKIKNQIRNSKQNPKNQIPNIVLATHNSLLTNHYPLKLMFKKFTSLLLSLSFVFTTMPLSHADDVQDCREEVVRALENVVGVSGRDALQGYLKDMSALLSTNVFTHKLVDQVEQMVRDARLEVTGVCTEVARFDAMDPFYRAAYDLGSCQLISSETTEANAQLSVLTFCEERSDALLDGLLNLVRDYLLRQSVRTSIEPVIQRMRSLNSRLTVLISEYSRLVNNFFTFSFRLGDTIIGEAN